MVTSVYTPTFRKNVDSGSKDSAGNLLMNVDTDMNQVEEDVGKMVRTESSLLIGVHNFLKICLQPLF